MYFIFDVHHYVQLVNDEAETMLELGETRYDYEQMKKSLVKQSKQDKHIILKDIEEKQEEIANLEERIA